MSSKDNYFFYDLRIDFVLNGEYGVPDSTVLVGEMTVVNRRFDRAVATALPSIRNAMGLKAGEPLRAEMHCGDHKGKTERVFDIYLSGEDTIVVTVTKAGRAFAIPAAHVAVDINKPGDEPATEYTPTESVPVAVL